MERKKMKQAVLSLAETTARKSVRRSIPILMYKVEKPEGLEEYFRKKAIPEI